MSLDENVSKRKMNKLTHGEARVILKSNGKWIQDGGLKLLTSSGKEASDGVKSKTFRRKYMEYLLDSSIDEADLGHKKIVTIEHINKAKAIIGRGMELEAMKVS